MRGCERVHDLEFGGRARFEIGARLKLLADRSLQVVQSFVVPVHILGELVVKLRKIHFEDRVHRGLALDGLAGDVRIRVVVRALAGNLGLLSGLESREFAGERQAAGTLLAAEIARQFLAEER